MSKPALKVKVRVQQFVTNTIDSVKINGKVWWPVKSITKQKSIKKQEFSTISDVNKPILLFVHQWSKMGGAGQLMEGMAYYMAQNYQYISVTFDMRGVGKSSGSSTWSGINEINDVLCITEWIKLNICKPIVIIGSSAGAPIAGSAFGNLSYPYIISGIFIGYPFGFWSSIMFGSHYNNIIESEKPKLFIMGDSDGFTSVQTLQNYIQKCKGDINDIYIEKDIGHFGLESPQFDTMICQLIHKFITNKINDNIDIKLWHKKLNKLDHDDNDNDEEQKNNDDDGDEDDGNKADDEQEENDDTK